MGHMHIMELEQRVRERGGRMTGIRKSILEAFLGADRPLLSSDISEAVAQNGMRVDRTTVYRELKFLVGAGIVSEIGLVGRKRSYELLDGHRHHLVCLGCHSVRSLSFSNHLGEEEARLFRDERFRVLDHSLEFYGYCENCRQ